MTVRPIPKDNAVNNYKIVMGVLAGPADSTTLFDRQVAAVLQKIAYCAAENGVVLRCTGFNPWVSDSLIAGFTDYMANKPRASPPILETLSVRTGAPLLTQPPPDYPGQKIRKIAPGDEDGKELNHLYRAMFRDARAVWLVGGLKEPTEGQDNFNLAATIFGRFVPAGKVLLVTGINGISTKMAFAVNPSARVVVPVGPLDGVNPIQKALQNLL